MSLTRLRQLAGPKVDLDARWAEFAPGQPDPDPMVFAVWLAERRLLTIDQLRDYLLDGDLHLQPELRGESTALDRLALLGKGAMGQVYVARDRLLNRNVAVKQIDPGMADDPVLLRRFYTEAQITAQLDHPGIVPVFGLEVQADGSLAYAMRIVRGRTLREYLTETRAFYEKGRVPDAAHALQARLLLFDDLCRVLQHAHERGVLHRDLKPQNIMVGPFGEVLVMDWGIAKVIGRRDELPTVVATTPEATETGASIGTARYMSPEQAAGANEQLDARSDQYALGLLLYELVTLSQAIQGQDVETCRTAAKRGLLAPVVHFRGESVPRDLEAIIRKATAFRPVDRYPDVGALAADVRRFLADEEVVARPDRPLQRVSRLIGRYRRAALVAIGGLSTTLVLVVAAFFVVAAVGVAAYTSVARARERALSGVLSAVSTQGHRIDTALSWYAARLEGMRGAAAAALTRPPPDPPLPVYLSSSFEGPLAGRPPDLLASMVYEDEISLRYADTTLAPGADPEALAPRLQQLATLHTELLRVELDAVDPALATAPEDEQRRRLLVEGGPIVWTYVATEDGVMYGVPGSGDYPEDYDPRPTVWYQLGRDAEQVRWEASMDESGGGLLLTAVSSVRDDRERILGVVGLDLTVEHVARTLLVPGGLPPVRARLVDADGHTLIDTTDPEAADKKPLFEHPFVVDAVRAGRTTGLQEAGDELVAWTTVDQVGWIYVVVGPTSVLTGG